MSAALHLSIAVGAIYGLPHLPDLSFRRAPPPAPLEVEIIVQTPQDGRTEVSARGGAYIAKEGGGGDSDARSRPEFAPADNTPRETNTKAPSPQIARPAPNNQLRMDRPQTGLAQAGQARTPGQIVPSDRAATDTPRQTDRGRAAPDRPRLAMEQAQLTVRPTPPVPADGETTEAAPTTALTTAENRQSGGQDGDARTLAGALGPTIAAIGNAIGGMPRPGLDADPMSAAAMRATDTIRTAAASGHPAAQFNLARRLWHGIGTPEDKPQALQWLTSAAEKGYVRAQLLIAFRAAAGDSVARDLGVADFWFSVAADRGNAQAQAARAEIARAMRPQDTARSRQLRQQYSAILQQMQRLPVNLADGAAIDDLLLDAVGKGDGARTRELLNKGADANAGDQNGRTAMISAAWRGRAEIIEMLIDRGMDPEDADHAGRTALMWSAINGFPEISSRLLNAGAAPDGRDGDGIAPLMRAAWNGHEQVVQALLRAGADPALRDPAGKTALDYARQGNWTAIELLLQNASSKR